jgi:hypothetical protein
MIGSVSVILVLPTKQNYCGWTLKGTEQWQAVRKIHNVSVQRADTLHRRFTGRTSGLHCALQERRIRILLTSRILTAS